MATVEQTLRKILQRELVPALEPLVRRIVREELDRTLDDMHARWRAAQQSIVIDSFGHEGTRASRS